MRFAVFFRPRLARAVLFQAQQVALKFRAVKRLDQRFRPLDHRAVASGCYYFWRSRPSTALLLNFIFIGLASRGFL
jgi:hypothetical protein